MVKNFSDVFNKYKTYDDSFGRGSVEEWKISFESKMSSCEAQAIIKNKNPLAIFDLHEIPALNILKQIYRKLLKENHPDVGGDHKKCKEIIAAFTILEPKCK